MFSYSKTAKKRVMNVQEVNLGRAKPKDHVGGRPQKKWRRDGLWKRGSPTAPTTAED